MTEETLDCDWLHLGYFDQREDKRGDTRTIKIRNTLDELHGRHFEISMVPRAPGVFRRTFYWREPEDGGDRAQYIAHIDENAPVMYIGLSVEKGEETDDPMHEIMDRQTWDWPRLVQVDPSRLESILKNLSQSLNRPVLVYVWSHTRTDQGSRCFVFLKDGFYERGVGTATVDDLKAVLRDIDVQGDTWVDAWIVCALAPSEVGRLKPSEAASLLYKFSELRTLLRGSEAGSKYVR